MARGKGKLPKKVWELSVLCDPHIGHRHHQLPVQPSNCRTMEELIERYKAASGGEKATDGCGDNITDPNQETTVLLQQINRPASEGSEVRYIYGNRANEHMNVDELNAPREVLGDMDVQHPLCKGRHVESYQRDPPGKVCNTYSWYELAAAVGNEKWSARELGQPVSEEERIKGIFLRLFHAGEDVAGGRAWPAT
ncbi:MADS-box transcription factor 26 [Zea mays]|uniref:MADS-box transcription factor 26 n=1 Tax=Zea mays TaxID=4577 RepID=A0A3L6FKE1_MAIZE|nr:MADS-box transcription factor 26 [Zea mays]